MKKKAFTLIELLVVVAIIGILAAVGVVAYNGYTNSAKASTMKSNHNLVVKQVNLILTSCEIEGSVQFMSQLNSKKYFTHTCYGNVQAFFQNILKTILIINWSGLTNLHLLVGMVKICMYYKKVVGIIIMRDLYSYECQQTVIRKCRCI
jgi:prepilin-type N-terminal cleavage/methylation domain-containing protein